MFGSKTNFLVLLFSVRKRVKVKFLRMRKGEIAKITFRVGFHRVSKILNAEKLTNTNLIKENKKIYILKLF